MKKIITMTILIAVMLLGLPGAPYRAVSAAEEDSESYTYRLTQSTAAYTFLDYATQRAGLQGLRDSDGYRRGSEGVCGEERVRAVSGGGATRLHRGT